MRFWDSSAVVTLAVEEPTSRACRAWLREDSHQVVWCLTRVEVLSALCRRQREGGLAERDLRRASTGCLLRRTLDWWTPRRCKHAAERPAAVHPLRR